MAMDCLMLAAFAGHDGNGRQSLAHKFLAQLFFRGRLKGRVARGMRNADAGHDARHANGRGYGGDGADLGRGNAGTLYFFGNRCAATSARASGGGEYDGVNSIFL